MLCCSALAEIVFSDFSNNFLFLFFLIFSGQFYSCSKCSRDSAAQTVRQSQRVGGKSKWIFNFQLYFNVANERRLFNWLILVLLRLIKRIFQYAKGQLPHMVICGRNGKRTGSWRTPENGPAGPSAQLFSISDVIHSSEKNSRERPVFNWISSAFGVTLTTLWDNQ